MAIETVNLGNLVNDGLGDDLRTAFQKVNTSLLSLNSELVLSGRSLGDGAAVYKRKSNTSGTVTIPPEADADRLEFRSIKGSANIVVTENLNDVTISSPLQNVFTKVSVPEASIIVGADTSDTTLTLIGGVNTSLAVNGKTITINTDPVGNILLQDLDLNTNDIIGTGNITINGNITANNFSGDLWGYNGFESVSALYSFDFGTYTNVFNNALQFIVSNTDFDMGTILTPTDLEIDLGTF
jgi:hypothetical protein